LARDGDNERVAAVPPAVGPERQKIRNKIRPAAFQAETEALVSDHRRRLSTFILRTVAISARFHCAARSMIPQRDCIAQFVPIRRSSATFWRPKPLPSPASS